MGRRRQFQENDAVDSATAVFSRRGYASTSIDHLVEATGVHRASLYGVFGSKHGLFLRVLQAVDAANVPSPVRLDVVLVGLLELAPGNQHVRDRINDLLNTHHITDEQLGSRLLSRAGLHTEKESA